MGKIQPKEFYFQKLKEGVETIVKLALANLSLLSKEEKKILLQLEEKKSAKAEWTTTKQESENKLQNPDPELKRMLAKDFMSEVFQRKSGGDPAHRERYNEPQFGIKLKHRNKRTVTIPVLKRDGEKTWYESRQAEIWEEVSNESAYYEWAKYMDDNLSIQSNWDFARLAKEIDKFLNGAPSIEKYGEPYLVFVEGGGRYEETSKLPETPPTPQDQLFGIHQSLEKPLSKVGLK